MANRGICKFYARGVCLKGEQCDFSHQRKDTPVDICAYYQKGSCAYGSRCKYKHVNAFQASPSAERCQSRVSDSAVGKHFKASQASSSANRRESLVLDSAAGKHVKASQASSSSAEGLQSLVSDSAVGVTHTTKGTSSWVLKPTKLSSSDKRAQSLQHKHQQSLGNGDVGESSTRIVTPSEHILCPANCPSRDNKCSLIHGNQCLYCKNYCLHPTDRKEKENHLRTCEKKEEALKKCEEVECNVCLERVLSKPKPSDCKFGLLPECDHAFCLSCIRNWRNSAPTSGMDINSNASTVRTCPVCRKLSYFVIPSDIWFSTKEEKQEIIDNYKANCRLTDCKHFNFGNGNCPFGASCFYKHKVKEGSYTWNHGKPPPRHGRPPHRRRPNNYDMYDVLDMLSEVELSSAEYYSIMRDSELFDEMDAYEMMHLSETLGSGPCAGLYNFDEDEEDEDFDFFQMAALSEAMASGGDGFDREDFENEELNPMEAALLSMMMHSNMDEEEYDDDHSDEDEY